ncbi:MAG TPA: AIM24 family protein [Candidatus Udaeobacter sp.]|nr:AIM24 family protein [Candidatus Udaeobacter sp.]
MASSSPQLLPMAKESETFAGVTYHIDGELVPVLTVDVSPDQPVYFEHHILLWKHPSVEIRIRPMKGALKRMVAGMQVFVTEATGTGQVAFSRDGAGHIFALHLSPSHEIDVREHQFLAATKGVDYSFERVKGVGTMLFGGTGFFIDRFTARGGEGILWLHGYGNVFEKDLAAGESIDVEPGGWLYKDASVKMTTNVQSLSTGFFGSMSFITNRFTGPGRLGIQSMYFHLPTQE